MTLSTCLISKFSRYFMVGIVNTIICSIVMFVGDKLNVHYLLYTALGYMVAMICSFFLNLRFTFQMDGNIWLRIGLFCCISLINLMGVEWLEFQLIEHYFLPPVFAIASGMVCYMLMGFFMHRTFTYSRQLS